MFHDLCTTIRECWDADAEARLSAGLIESRVAEMAQVFKVTFLSFVRHIKSSLQGTAITVQTNQTQRHAPPPPQTQHNIQPVSPIAPNVHFQPYFQPNIIPPNVNYETGDGSTTTGPPGLCFIFDELQIDWKLATEANF